VCVLSRPLRGLGDGLGYFSQACAQKTRLAWAVKHLRLRRVDFIYFGLPSDIDRIQNNNP